MSRDGAFGAVIGVLAIGLAAFNADAQVSPSPGPPAPGSQRITTQAAGTAVIRGRVYDRDNGEPLRRALVRATPSDMVEGHLEPFGRENQVATTDEQGRYELHELRAGHYTVTASKGTYVDLAYDQARPSDSVKLIEILDGQTVDKVDVRLPRGGVITGHVVDEYGDPMSNIEVGAMRSQFIQGRRRLMFAGRFAVTDDLGEYRLFGLIPSDYYISATYRPPPVSAADADAPGYAVTYFPGTASAAQAQRVTIGIGGSFDDVNIVLVPVKTAQITGAVVNGQGQPMAGGFVTVMERGGAIGVRNGAPLRPDGTFIVRNVAPGEYRVRAQSPFKQGERLDVATTMITVAGQDIDGVQLVVMPPSTASGVLLVEPAAAAAIKASSIRLMVLPADEQEVFMDTSGRLHDDLTFEANVQPGNNMIKVIGMPDGFALTAVRVNGVDVTDTGLEVKPNEKVSGIEIELTSHPTQVSGQVTDSRGIPTKDCTVVVFARDERKWEGTSRYVGATKPEPDGKFRVSGLPPGDYHAVAIDRIEPGQWVDPDVLSRIRNQAATLSLGDGETKVLDLKLTIGF